MNFPRKTCDCGAPAVDCLDGDYLCQEHADQWAESEERDFHEARKQQQLASLDGEAPDEDYDWDEPGSELRHDWRGA